MVAVELSYTCKTPFFSLGVLSGSLTYIFYVQLSCRYSGSLQQETRLPNSSPVLLILAVRLGRFHVLHAMRLLFFVDSLRTLR